MKNVNNQKKWSIKDALTVRQAGDDVEESAAFVFLDVIVAVVPLYFLDDFTTGIGGELINVIFQSARSTVPAPQHAYFNVMFG